MHKLQDMDIKEKAGDFLLDIAKLIFGGVLLAGIMAEDIDRVLLYSIGSVAFFACGCSAYVIFRQDKKED